MSYKEIKIDELECNPVTMFSKGWALLSAKNGEKYNSMTVSWGALGELWGKDVAFCFVRPQRYTFEFTEKSDYFTLAFYFGENKKELGVFGSVSGRDCDKYEKTGFNVIVDGDVIYPDNAELVLVCRKVAFQDIAPDGFIDGDIDLNYEKNDYHRAYVGEIVSVLKNNSRKP